MANSGFASFERRAKNATKALKDDFLIILFGPYAGICEGIMNEICSQLDRENYNARICKCHPDPEFPSNATSEQKNFLRSKKCLEDADAAVFIFFEAVQGRFPNWDDSPTELNASVIRELGIWIDSLKRPPRRSLVVFEGNLRENYGSLIPGTVDNYGCEEESFEQSDFEELYDCIVATSWKWVNQR